MIHHLSISAENPQHVAQVLAEILQGQPTPHPYNSGGYTVFLFDEHGTEIEIYSLGTGIVPGDSEELRTYIQNAPAFKATATHTLISTTLSTQQIEQIAARENWLVQRSSFGFEYILLWVENRLLIELLTPEMTAQYLAFTRPENLRKYFIFSDSQDAPKS
jgi:hypothetical protein